MKRALVLLCAVGAAVGLLVGPHLVARAPLAYELGFHQKIFYYHVPAAWVMFLSAVVCGVASAVYLATRRASWDDVASAAGELTVLFGLIVMTTGPIWARAAWGAYWVWEARLTTSLLLWMIFIAYALLRRFAGHGAERLAAGLAIFGMADVPLVYFAVSFWSTQHPGNRVVEGLPPGMRAPFAVAMLAFTLLVVVLLSARAAIASGQRRVAAVTERAVEMGLLE